MYLLIYIEAQHLFPPEGDTDVVGDLIEIVYYFVVVNDGG
jgi:hypothetical protein